MTVEAGSETRRKKVETGRQVRDLPRTGPAGAVARSGEIGYVSGTWQFTVNDPARKPATDRGKFVEVLKKQADGTWKCTTDIWNSDLPLPAEKKQPSL